MTHSSNAYGDNELVFTTDSGEMYEVAKLDNEGDYMRVFVHNQLGKNEPDSKYGEFGVICDDGCFLVDDDGFHECTTHDLFKAISTRPDYHWEKYGDWILETIANCVDGKEVDLTPLANPNFSA